MDDSLFAWKAGMVAALVTALIVGLVVYAMPKIPTSFIPAEVLAVHRDGTHHIALRIEIQQHQKNFVMNQTESWSRVSWVYPMLPKTPQTGTLALNVLGHPIALTLSHPHKTIFLSS